MRATMPNEIHVRRLQDLADFMDLPIHAVVDCDTPDLPPTFFGVPIVVTDAIVEPGFALIETDGSYHWFPHRMRAR